MALINSFLIWIFLNLIGISAANPALQSALPSLPILLHTIQSHMNSEKTIAISKVPDTTCHFCTKQQTSISNLGSRPIWSCIQLFITFFIFDCQIQQFFWTNQNMSHLYMILAKKNLGNSHQESVVGAWVDDTISSWNGPLHCGHRVWICSENSKIF